jgi:hypothetical protein
MKLYLTGVPERPGVAATQALRAALALIGNDTTARVASALIQSLQDESRPIFLGETFDDEALKAARLKLSEAHMTCAQDLPDEALVAPTPEPESSIGDTVSYLSCQFALIAMQATNGNPATAIHHALTYARLVGETREKPGAWRAAVSVLIDTFPPTIQTDIMYLLVDAGYIPDPADTTEDS